MAAIPVGPGRAEPEPGGTRAGAAVNAIGVTTTPHLILISLGRGEWGAMIRSWFGAIPMAWVMGGSRGA